MPNKEYDVDNFRREMTVTIEFQILSHNFKSFKKVDIIKLYLFWLLGIYFINDLIYLIMSSTIKRQ